MATKSSNKKTLTEYKNITMDLITSSSINSYNFPNIEKNESSNASENNHEDIKSDDSVSYITDIHLLHRFEANHCKIYPKDYIEEIEKITDKLAKESVQVNLIGGDVSSDFVFYKLFFDKLTSKTNNIFFVTLGNHELWPFNNKPLSKIVKIYDEYLSSKGIFLLHNNLYYFCEDGIFELTFEMLSKISDEELKELTKNASLVIFGGMGFAGCNENFNAKQGIYLNVVSRKEEKIQTTIFFKLYMKVCRVLNYKNVIVLTHMPPKDWDYDYYDKGKSLGFIFVNGHDHNNYYYDDSAVRIYSDNQIGYHRKNVSLKYLSIKNNDNSLSKYVDGIHKITKNEYYKFNRELNVPVEFNRNYQAIYMIKRENYYMFLMKSLNGSLNVLNGGQLKSAGKHSLQYFYDNILLYAEAINDFLDSYNSYLKEVSKEVRKIGGLGKIHGCIVDIDYYNHLFVNPFDASMTPYYATSIADKYVYKNFVSLIYKECPTLYEKYKGLAKENNEKSLILYNPNDLIVDERLHNTDTRMYSFSERISNFQYIEKNIIRRWIDDYIGKTPYEIAKLLLQEVNKQYSKEKTYTHTYQYQRIMNKIRRSIKK